MSGFHASIYLVNLLCALVPCDNKFPYPDTSFSEPQLFKDNIKFNTVGYSQYYHSSYHHTKHGPPLVTTKSGVIQGFWMRVVGGKLIRAFEGIPYAEPPIGHLRFRV